MAYQVSKTSAMQTAIKAAVDVAVAELGAGLLSDQSQLEARINELRDWFFTTLDEYVEQDRAANGENASTSNKSDSTKPVSLEDAYNTVVNYGAFEGLTLAQIYYMTAQEAETYSTGRGRTPYTRSGLDWLRWAANDRNPQRRFIAERAKLVLDNPPQVGATP